MTYPIGRELKKGASQGELFDHFAGLLRGFINEKLKDMERRGVPLVLIFPFPIVPRASGRLSSFAGQRNAMFRGLYKRISYSY